MKEKNILILKVVSLRLKKYTYFPGFRTLMLKCPQKSSRRLRTTAL